MTDMTILNITNSRRAYGIYFILMLLLAALAFENLRSFHFLDGWDDRDMLAETARASQNLSAMFSQDRVLAIRPTSDIVLVIAYWMWQDNPIFYRALQIGLHLIASLLLASVFTKLGADIELSWMSAAFFLVNPAHFRAVHWINTIHYEVAFIWSMVCLLNFVAYIKSSRRIFLYFSVGALFAAIFAHPSAVSIALFCVYFSWQQTKSIKGVGLSTWPLLLCAMIGGLGAHFISPHSVQDHGFFATPSLSRIVTNFFWYIGRLWTSAIWLTRATTSTKPHDWEIAIGAGFVLLALQAYRKGAFPAAHWAFWIPISILPFVNTLPYRLAFGPSRHLYFASAGASFLLAWTLRKLAIGQTFFSTLQTRRHLLVIVFGALCLVNILSLRKAEALSIYFAGRGYAFRVNKQPALAQRAVELFVRSIHHAPTLVPVDAYTRLLGMGLLFGKPYREIIHQAKQQHIDPAFVTIWGIIADLAEAAPEDWMRHEIRIQKVLYHAPNNGALRKKVAIFIQNLAGFYYQNQRYQQVIDLCKMALRFNPDYALAQENLEKAYQALAEPHTKP